jgi:trk system potassium uptake protein TrkA
MHVIVLGGGEIGFALAQALSARHQVFVIDHDPQVADRFEPLDVQFLLGPATSADLLGRAGIDKADVLVACTGLDEVNIVACALANEFGSPRSFCFVSREEFFDLPQEQGLGRFGISRLVWPEAQLAEDIERIVRAPGAMDAEVFADGAIHMLEYRLDEASSLIKKRVADLGLPRGALVVAVRRGDHFFIPRGDSRLDAGDKAIVMGLPEALAEVGQRAIAKGVAKRPRVAIIGGGDVGFRLAKRLESGGPFDVTIVERDQARGELLAAHLQRTLVLNGDGTDLELLESEGLGRSDVLVSVIDHDERNLLASLLGRQLGAKRIITRVGRRANLRLFERVGIDVAISARGAAVASVLNQIEGGSARLLAIVEQGAGRVLELDVPPGYQAKALRDLAAPHDSIVGAIVRQGRAVVPRGDDQIQAGDRLIVFTTRESADNARESFTSLAT